MQYMYRLGAFFALFLFLGATTEGIWQNLANKESGQGALLPLLQRVEQLAASGRDQAAATVKAMQAPESGFVVLEPTSNTGLASLRKRKILAATQADLAGTTPTEEIAQAAADIKSLSLEKKFNAQAKELPGGVLLLSAPLSEGGLQVGCVIVKQPTPATSSQAQWPLLLLIITLGAALCAALCAGEANVARGVKTLLGAGITWGAALSLHLESPSGVVMFSVLGGLASVLGFLAGTGHLGRWWAPIKKERHAYSYIAPAMIGMLLLVFVPFVVGVGLSFFEHEFGAWRFVGLQNFSKIMFSGNRAITSPDSFYFKLVVTLLWTTLNVFFHVSIGLGLALLLNQPNLKGRTAYRLILVLPWAVPSYITALIWKRMFHPEIGIINGLLGWEGFSWTDTFAKAFFANLMTNIWLGVPFMMVVCLGALQSIPKDVYEAADIDGASSWQQFWKITVPLLRPSLLPSIILGMIWTFNMFNVIYLVSEGKPGGATDILVTEAYRWAFERQERGGEYGYAAAYSTIIFVLLLFYSLGTAKLTGLTKGADD